MAAKRKAKKRQRRKPPPAAPVKTTTPGGQGEPPKRSELQLEQQALRNDWPIPQQKKGLILARCLQFFGRKRPGQMVAADRTVLSAARTIGMLSRLSLLQAAQDLRREKFAGKKSDVSLADLVAQAEARAEARKRERDK